MIGFSLSKFTANAWWDLISEWYKLPEEELDKLLILMDKELGKEYMTSLIKRIDKLLEFGRRWWY